MAMSSSSGLDSPFSCYHDMYLFEVKKPEESKRRVGPLQATVPGDEAFRPLDKGGCPLVKTN
jgi:branched-chain amino acid transport system substrate-binding protein